MTLVTFATGCIGVQRVGAGLRTLFHLGWRPARYQWLQRCPGGRVITAAGPPQDQPDGPPQLVPYGARTRAPGTKRFLTYIVCKSCFSFPSVYRSHCAVSPVTPLSLDFEYVLNSELSTTPRLDRYSMLGSSILSFWTGSIQGASLRRHGSESLAHSDSESEAQPQTWL
jgi:hypothetical protein